jgi:hypothetical protein
MKIVLMVLMFLFNVGKDVGDDVNNDVGDVIHDNYLH